MKKHLHPMWSVLVMTVMCGGFFLQFVRWVGDTSVPTNMRTSDPAHLILFALSWGYTFTVMFMVLVAPVCARIEDSTKLISWLSTENYNYDDI